MIHGEGAGKGKTDSSNQLNTDKMFGKKQTENGERNGKREKVSQCL